MSLWKVVLGISIAFAQTGVGVGLGKVQVSQPLGPGEIHRLPDLPVVNTGEGEGIYKVRAVAANVPIVVGNEAVEAWFRFSPSSFNLSPNQTRLVDVSISLPLDAPSGDYLVFLEASSCSNSEGQVKISPAAATKLHFSVQSGSVLGAVRNRVLTFVYTRPEIYLVLAAIFLLQALLILRRHFRVEIRPRRNRNLR
jgi:hypothetical protein